jgi:hypothetical protein
MKHNFKTLFILVIICLPWGIFAQQTQLPDCSAPYITPHQLPVSVPQERNGMTDYLTPYITPHQLPVSVPQERNEMPVLLIDSSYWAIFDPQTHEIVSTFSSSSDYNTSDKISTYIETTEDAFNVVTSTRSTYFYNTSNGKLSVIERATKDGTNWIPKEKTMYAYDCNNYLAEVKTIDNMNIVKFRNTYINNSSGSVLESRHELPYNNSLKLQSRVVYSINTNNKTTLVEYKYYDLATGVISGRSKTIYEYDAAGNILLSITQNLNTSTSKWYNVGKIVNTYTSNNLFATTERSNPSLSNPTEWKPSSLKVLTYINQIERDSIIDYTWSVSGWQPLNLTLYQYANGQVIKDSSYARSFNQWNITSRNFHKPADDIYSIARGLSEGIEAQRYDNGVWTTLNSLINEHTDLGNNLAKWGYRYFSPNSFNILDTSSYCNAYYHRIFPDSTIETVSNKSTTITPNPYKIGQTIRCIGLENSTDLTFSLYDLAGALLSKQNFDGGRGLVLPATVGAGMYIAVIRQGAQRLKTTKIVVVNAP